MLRLPVNDIAWICESFYLMRTVSCTNIGFYTLGGNFGKKLCSYALELEFYDIWSLEMQ